MRNNLIVKRVKLFLKVDSNKLLKKRSPIVAYLLVTDQCNLRCSYCFVGSDTNRRELFTEEWLKLIDHLYENGTKMICLMGGEPLLHKDIDTIVEHTVSKGIICDMTTNGILVPQKIGTVKKLDSLMVSLDGNRDANDVNRGKGSFDKALEAIRIARESGVVVRVNAVMTKQSKDDIEFLLDLADRYALYVTFSITAEFPEKYKSRENQVMLNESEVKELYKRLRILKSKGRRVLFSLPTIDYVINYPLPYNKIILRGDREHEKYYTERCPFGQSMFYVDANGDFYPCAALWNSEYYKPKNLISDSFSVAWNNMADLKCSACFCPGVPEWNRIMSWKGLFSGIKITLQQALIRR